MTVGKYDHQGITCFIKNFSKIVIPEAFAANQKYLHLRHKMHMNIKCIYDHQNLQDVTCFIVTTELYFQLEGP